MHAPLLVWQSCSQPGGGHQPGWGWLQRDAREIALREAWARERDAALDREQAAASERLRDTANRHEPLKTLH